VRRHWACFYRRRKRLVRNRPEPGDPYGWIFPPFVATAVCRGEACWTFHAEEGALVREVAPQRACEFAVGRLCAHRVLAALGVEERPLLIGADGAPEWPGGIAGSISHTTGFCVAAACRIGDAAGLGVDVEQAEGVTRDLVPLLATPVERAWVGSFARGRGPSLLFSGFPLEFSDVEITLAAATHRFMARLANANAPPVFGMREFHGRYWIDDRFVHTGLCFPGRTAHWA
jgi:hypothetical protein